MNVEVAVGEKGGAGSYIRVRGTPGHGSRPWGSDNAVVKAAEIVHRISSLRPRARISDTWRTWVDAQPFDDELRAALVDPDRIDEHLHELDPVMAPGAHACTHRTYSVNIVQGGVKANVIPEEALVVVDVRVPPGDTRAEAIADLRELLADYGDDVSIDVPGGGDPSLSSTETPLWDVLSSAARAAHGEAHLVPTLITGGTDGRHWRRAGRVAYGFGILSARLDPSTYWSRFHAHDERVDVESLRLSVATWDHVCRRFLA
jgi:acetylornithine deacetylase/succinyl-diaminopimelate desuccinylase-like protein